MRVAGSGEPLGLVCTAGSDGNVGVTTGGLLGGVRFVRSFCCRCLLIH